MNNSLRVTVLAITLSAAVACTGRSQGTPAAPAPSAEASRSTPAATPAASSKPASADSAAWLVADSSTQTASISLVITRPRGASSALINGYRGGQAQIVVPVRWTIKWNWRNDDASEPHSLVVMTQREKIPLEGGRAAFSNAMSRQVTEGLAKGQTDQTTFEAEEAGWYWLLCGVPNHALNGEWLELRVSPDAKTASVELKKFRP